MIRAMLRMCGLVDSEADPEKFEPVFGLPRESMEEWLARHPAMRERYEAELARISQRPRRNLRKDRSRMSPAK